MLLPFHVSSKTLQNPSLEPNKVASEGFKKRVLGGSFGKENVTMQQIPNEATVQRKYIA